MRCNRAVEGKCRRIAGPAENRDDERSKSRRNPCDGFRSLHGGNQGAGQSDQFHSFGENSRGNDDTDDIAIGIAHTVKKLFGHFIHLGQRHCKSKRRSNEHGGRN